MAKSLVERLADQGGADIDNELEQRDRQAAERRQTKTQRAQRSKARRRRAQKRTMSWDLPPALIEEVKQVATRESISQSNLVGLALSAWLSQYHAGQFDFAETRYPSRSPRFLWIVEIPPIQGKE